MTHRIRVLVIDDHPMVRQGLHALLSQYSDIEMVGESDGQPGTIDLISQLLPDVALLDIRLAGASGIDLARQIRRSGSPTRVIILTSYDDESYLLEAAHAGAHGYMLKSASAEVLADAIRSVYAGQRQLSPELASKALTQLEALTRLHAQVEAGVTDLELQLIRMIVDGASTHDMALALYLSERTVKRKLQDLLTKLGATSRAQAVAEAYKRGLL
jgi:two-component system, NarL family, response regulator DevR